jgi:C-terminal domain on Strawberry notch homologue
VATVVFLIRQRRRGAPFYSINEAHKKDVPRFLNRMLGMQLRDQKLLFDYFQHTVEATIQVLYACRC